MALKAYYADGSVCAVKVRCACRAALSLLLRPQGTQNAATTTEFDFLPANVGDFSVLETEPFPRQNR